MVVKGLMSTLVLAVVAVSFSGIALAQSAAPRFTLTDAQAETLAKQTFPQIDKNGDGRISREEMTGFTMAHGHNALDEKSWKAADKNGDGYLSPDELGRAIKLLSDQQSKH